MTPMLALVVAYWRYQNTLSQEDKEWLETAKFEATLAFGEDAVRRELNRLDDERRRKNEARTQ